MKQESPKQSTVEGDIEKHVQKKESENMLYVDVLKRKKRQKEQREAILKEKKEKNLVSEIEESDKENAENLSNEIKETSAFNEFNIFFDELEKMSGFEALSHGQRLLVVENLKQIALGRVHEEAGEKYKEDTANARFLGRVWKGISKKYQIAKLEKVTANDITAGGIGIHGDILKHLIKRAGDGPDVEVTKDGKLEILYTSNTEGLSSYQKQEVESFNQTATKFSKIPKEWSHETASKKEQKEYKELQEQYEKEKAGILDIERSKLGYKEAALYMNDIDSRVYSDQFLNTHPEVEEQLQNITDKSIWVRAMANVATERGLYFVGGFITRTLTTSMLGLAGAPLAAAGMGGFVARKRAKEALVEHEIGARRGEDDKSAEAKNFVSVDSMREKLERLTEKVSMEENPEKKAKLLISLRARISYAQGKMEDGLMNYGKGVDRFASQYELISSLSRAVAHTGAGRTGKSKLEMNLDDFLSLKEGKISEAQKKYIKDQTIRGAVMGAGFAVAGYALRYFGEEWFGWEEATNEPTKAQVSAVESTHTQRIFGVEENIQNLAVEIQNTPEYITQSGDNIWKIIENKLGAHDIFRGLEEGQRTHLIDEFKDKVSSMSQEELREFGISSGNPNLIHAGESLDFSKIMNIESISSGVSSAENLTDAQIVSIEANNIKLADWAESHLDTDITAEKINAIVERVKTSSDSITIQEEMDKITTADIISKDFFSLGGTSTYNDTGDSFSWKFTPEQENILGSPLFSAKKELNNLYFDGSQGMFEHKPPSIVYEKVEDVMSKGRLFHNEEAIGFTHRLLRLSNEDVISKTQEYIQALVDRSGIKPLPDEEVRHFIERVIFTEKEHIDSYTGLAQKLMDEKIENIYEYGFSIFKGSQIEEWNGNIVDGVVGVKDMKVADIFNGDFGAPVSGSFSVAHNNRKQLLDFLYELRKTVEPKTGETTGGYVERAIQDKITPDDFIEYLHGLGAEITYKYKK